MCSWWLASLNNDNGVCGMFDGPVHMSITRLETVLPFEYHTLGKVVRNNNDNNNADVGLVRTLERVEYRLAFLA